MAASAHVVFSPDGEYFVLTEADGNIRVWDCATGFFRQQYIPSSHLKAITTSSCWISRTVHKQKSGGQFSTSSASGHESGDQLHDGHSLSPNVKSTQENERQKKKRRSKRNVSESASQEHATEQALALGTASGSVLLYSIIKGEPIQELNEGHSKAVQGMSFRSCDETLFTCSADHYLIEWDTYKGSVRRKWKGGNEPVYSVSAAEDKIRLLSASRRIKCWNLETLTVTQTFTGHATPVRHLQFVPGMKSAGYFISVSDRDRVISAWQIDEAKSKATAVATLMLSDEPRHLDMVAADTHHSTTLVATTAAQEIEIFEFQLNGHHQEPVKPCSRIQIRSKQENSFSEDPQKQRIFGGKVLHQGSSRKLLLAYGSALKPSFENLEYSSLGGEVIIKRKDAARTMKPSLEEASNTLVMSGMKAKRARFLGPGTIGIVPVGKEPSLPLLMEAKEAFGGGKSSQRETSYMDGKKAKEKERKGTGDETIGERLETMKRDSAQATAPPMDGLAHLLLQGLQSNDKAVLRSVLDRTEESVRKGTICRLPVPAISPLINTLQKLIAQKRDVTHVKWLQTVLEAHMPYLLSNPSMEHLLEPINRMIEMRFETMKQVSHLTGRVHSLLNHLEIAKDKELQDISHQLPIKYQKDDASDTSDLERELLGVPESYDDWDEWDDSDHKNPDFEHPMAEDGEDEDEDDDDDDDDEDEEEVDVDSAEEDKMFLGRRRRKIPNHKDRERKDSFDIDLSD